MDQLSLLENKLEAEFDLCVARIADGRYVQDWPDYQHRAGYIAALRRFGDMIKEARNPEAVHDNEDGIPSVFEQINDDGKDLVA